MNRLMRHAMTFAAGGLAGAVVIATVPAAFAATPTTEPAPPTDSTTSNTQPAPPTVPRGGSARSPGEVNRMIDECGQVMRGPRMRQLMSQYMSGGAATGGTSTGSSMMGGSGGSMMGTSN